MQINLYISCFHLSTFNWNAEVYFSSHLDGKTMGHWAICLSWNLEGGAGVWVGQLLHHLHNLLGAQPFARGEARMGENWERSREERQRDIFWGDSADWGLAFWGDGKFALSLPAVSSHPGEDDDYYYCSTTCTTCTQPLWCLEKMRIPLPEILACPSE